MSRPSMALKRSSKSLDSEQRACGICMKRGICLQISENLQEIHRLNETVWELEYRFRFQSLQSELTRLGFTYPASFHFCELQRLGHLEAVDLLRETQELRLELKNASLKAKED